MNTHIVITQNVSYFDDSFDDRPPKALAKMVDSGDWPDQNNQVNWDRVQVYRDDILVYDDEPGDCSICGRNDHQGFVDGEPRCHRHEDGSIR